MAAPRGATYTPKRGPLAGQTFHAPPGRTAPTAAYNAYQNALARYKTGGRSRTYAAQRRIEGHGVVANLERWIRAHRDESRFDARELAREFWQGESYHGPTAPAVGSSGRVNRANDAQRARKHRMMRWLAEQGYIDTDADREEAWDTLDY